MKLFKGATLKAAKRKVPRGMGPVLAAITGALVGAGVVLKGREAAHSAAVALAERTVQKD